MKNTTNKIIKSIFAVILLIYPLRNAFTGLDLMDAGYSLGNYRFFDVMNETWRTATFLANVVGVALSKFPYGSTWIGMNIYTGLLVGLTASIAFLYFSKNTSLKMTCAFFVSEFVALSLCWSPTAVLYHYLGYILMTVTVMVLYIAIIKDNKRYFMIAGVLLGLCVAVRMPNITYMAFILPLWYYCFINKKTIDIIINRTLMCIAGYAVGLIVPIMYICIKYGVSAYPRMINSLFGMTDDATDYKPTSMITAMLGDYINYSGWLILFVVYGIAGIILFKITSDTIYVKKLVTGNKITKVIKIFYIAGILVLVRFCYGRGMFDFDYTTYFSMYKWATVYLLMIIVICIYILLFYKNSEQSAMQMKIWAVFLLVIIFITPLGSNNGLYPIINNLFIVAPVSVYMITEIFKNMQHKKISPDNLFIYKSICLLIIAGISIQGILFGMGFVFHDAGAKTSDSVKLELKCSNTANGIKTTTHKKSELEELDRYIYDNALSDKKVILYGDIPSIAYIFDMKPAVFSTWADLDSNSIDILAQELEAWTSQSDKDSLPIIIFGRTSIENLTDIEKLSYKKLQVINQFIKDNEYMEVFRNESYIVYN